MTSVFRVAFVLLLTAAFGQATFADGPADNIPTNVRAIPPLGAELEAADTAEIEQGLAKLNADLDALQKNKDARIQSLIPDVEIFARAIRDGLRHREFYPANDAKAAGRTATAVLKAGLERSTSLLAGEAPWLNQKGLVVRGYRSKIDRTVQPYGLVIPASYSLEGAGRYRLDLWLHGRGETLSESAFIQQRMTQVGNISPRDTIVLHPYGRYCNANKLAGEIDVLEALEHAKQYYRIDDDRVAVRGFSMGGAGCWQMAVHYPDLFFAATPGAGFSETPEFLKVFQNEELAPTWYEQSLWQMYDCTGWGLNLTMLPTIAYSGELDTQKQAADIMQQALAKDHIKLTHLIGPQTKHAIHPESLKLIESKLASLAAKGRERIPASLQFTTYTLRYNRSHWLTVTGLKEHWKKAVVSAGFGPIGKDLHLRLTNVTGLRVTFPAGGSPFTPGLGARLFVDDQQIGQAITETDRSLSLDLRRDGDEWKLDSTEPTGLVKRHGLQGPIDDAFLDTFIVVRPTGTGRHKLVDEWSKAEFAHCVDHWRKQFRGDAIIKDDNSITDEDIQSANLILFGDPSSNSVLKRIADRLPIQWTASEVAIGTDANAKTYSAAEHAPILIYPNPLNESRYVVLNSGFTFREYAYLNNARQVPKLPDWAIVDLRSPPNPLSPGKVVAADYFGERWEVRPPRN